MLCGCWWWRIEMKSGSIQSRPTNSRRGRRDEGKRRRNDVVAIRSLYAAQVPAPLGSLP